MWTVCELINIQISYKTWNKFNLYENNEKCILGVMTVMQCRVWKIDVAARVWVYWALAKKMSGKLKKNERFTWFWALFVIKQWSQVEGSSPNASGVDSHGCNNWRGCQNLSLLRVSKLISGKLIKLLVFLGF